MLYTLRKSPGEERGVGGGRETAGLTILTLFRPFSLLRRIRDRQKREKQRERWGEWGEETEVLCSHRK